MKLPSKIFTVKESVLFFFPIILEYLEREKEKNIYDLYQNTIKFFPSNKDWMDTIACLYAIRAINLNEEKEALIYAL